MNLSSLNFRAVSPLAGQLLVAGLLVSTASFAVTLPLQDTAGLHRALDSAVDIAARTDVPPQETLPAFAPVELNPEPVLAQTPEIDAHQQIAAIEAAPAHEPQTRSLRPLASSIAPVSQTPETEAGAAPRIAGIESLTAPFAETRDLAALPRTEASPLAGRAPRLAAAAPADLAPEAPRRFAPRSRTRGPDFVNEPVTYLCPALYEQSCALLVQTVTDLGGTCRDVPGATYCELPVNAPRL